MSSAPNQPNPKFCKLCMTLLDSIEARLSTMEQGWRPGPDLHQVHQDLLRLAEWTSDIPNLKKRTEQLGESYAKNAFSPMPEFPQKYIPTPRVLPSIRSGQDATPIADAEVERMLIALNDTGFPIDVCETPTTTNPRILQIGSQAFHPGRLRRALASGLISGGPAIQLDSLLLAILVAMSGQGISTGAIRNASKILSAMFPQDAEWLIKRFTVLRSRLINEGYIKRSGKSYWQRCDPRNSHRVRASFDLLDRLEKHGAEPFAATDGKSNHSEESQ